MSGPAPPLLKVEALTKRFGGFTAVDRVSFSVAEGEILGLLGPNGSGKSTTFNCIAGMLKPTAGSVLLGGEEIGGLTADQACRRGIGRTFQIPRPFRSLSLLENAALAAHYGAGGAPAMALGQTTRALASSNCITTAMLRSFCPAMGWPGGWNFTP